jgi:hypothetical protein
MRETATNRTQIFYDLRDALAEPGCPVCHLRARGVDRYLDSLLYESINDPGVRHDIREARGFCHRHAWQLVRPSASLGAAILHHDVIETVLEVLEEARFQAPPLLSLQRLQESLAPRAPGPATADLAKQLEPQQPCPACRMEERREVACLNTLVGNLTGEEGLLDAFRSSAGLCLPHFRQALALTHKREVFEALVEAQCAIWQRLEADLGEFIRKTDYRFQDEPYGQERDAWLRGIAAVSGSR